MRNPHRSTVRGDFESESERVTLFSRMMTPINLTIFCRPPPSFPVPQLAYVGCQITSTRLSVLSASMPRNEPGPPDYRYSGPLYGLPGGTPHPTYEGTYYPETPVSPCVRISVGYDYDTSQRRSVDPSPVYSGVQSTNEPYPPSFGPQRRQRSPGFMNEALPPSQGPAGVQNYNGAGYTTIASTSGPFTRTTSSHLLPCLILD